MKLLAFDHVLLAIPAGQEDKARAFYGGILGMDEIPKPPELAKRGGAWFRAGSVVIHIGVEADYTPPYKAHPALVVDNLEAFLQACQANGIATDTSEPPLEGYKRAYIFDPFGNCIELMEKV